MDYLAQMQMQEEAARDAAAQESAVEDTRAKVKERGERQAQEAAARQPIEGADFFLIYQTLYNLNPDSPYKDYFSENFDVLDDNTDKGGVLVRSKTSGHSIEVNGGGVYGEALSDEAQLTDKGIEYQIELALTAKAMPSAVGGLEFHGATELSQMMGEKAAELVGVRLLNASEQGLDESNPELAQRMEQVWERMKTERPELALAAGQDNYRPGQDAESQVGNLYRDILEKVGMPEDQIEAALQMDQKGRLETIAAYGRSFIGEGEHPDTGTAMVSEFDQRAIDEANKLLETHGIDDPEGKLAEGIAAVTQTLGELKIEELALEGRSVTDGQEPGGNVAAETYDALMAQSNEHFKEALIRTGMTEDQLNPELGAAARIENIARHGQYLMDDTTGAAQISEGDIDPVHFEIARDVLKHNGIEDTDGTLTKGFAAMSQTIANDPQLFPGLQLLRQESTPAPATVGTASPNFPTIP